MPPRLTGHLATPLQGRQADPRCAESSVTNSFPARPRSHVFMISEEHTISHRSSFRLEIPQLRNHFPSAKTPLTLPDLYIEFLRGDSCFSTPHKNVDWKVRKRCRAPLKPRAEIGEQGHWSQAPAGSASPRAGRPGLLGTEQEGHCPWSWRCPQILCKVDGSPKLVGKRQWGKCDPKQSFKNVQYR